MLRQSNGKSRSAELLPPVTATMIPVSLSRPTMDSKPRMMQQKLTQILHLQAMDSCQ